MKGKSWSQKVALVLTFIVLTALSAPVIMGIAWGINRIVGNNFWAGEGLVFRGSGSRDSLHVQTGWGMHIYNDAPQPLISDLDDSLLALTGGTMSGAIDMGDKDIFNIERMECDTIEISGDLIEDFAGDGLSVTSNKLVADLGISIVTGEITDQTIVKADIDTTSTFVFGAAYHKTSAVADSEYVTKGYADGLSGAPGGSDTQIQYNDGGGFGGIAGFIWDDTNIEIADDIDLAFGTGADWLIQYDETVDDQLLFLTAGTGAVAITDPMFEIIVGTTPTADQEVFGIAKGTQVSNTPLFTVDEDGDGVFAGDLDCGDNSIDPAEIDEGGTFTWTGTHGFTGATVNLGTGAVDAAAEVSADVIEESHLKVTGGAAVDEDIFTYESTTGDFEWHTPAELGLLSEYTQFWGENDFAISWGSDDSVEVIYPISEKFGNLTHPYFVRNINASDAADDQKDTLVFSGRLPLGYINGIDSITVPFRTSTTTAATSGITVIIYAMCDLSGFAPADTVKAVGTQIASGSAGVWSWLTINMADSSDIGPGSWIRVEVECEMDYTAQAETVDVERPYFWGVAK